MPPFLKNTDKEVDNMGTTKKISGKAMGVYYPSWTCCYFLGNI